jgi:hypothetical protein
MRSAMELWPCDESCKDAARFFYGCPNIVAVKTGKEFSWLPIPEGESDAEIKKRNRARIAECRETGELPSWIERVLKNGAGEGQRHYFCYRLGATLINLGYSEEKIIGLIMKSPLRQIGLAEIERAVANGAERGLRDFGEGHQ